MTTVNHSEKDFQTRQNQGGVYRGKFAAGEKTRHAAAKKNTDSLWWRANARNVSFSVSVRWSIYIINSIDKPNFQKYVLPYEIFYSKINSESFDLYISEISVET